MKNKQKNQNTKLPEKHTRRVRVEKRSNVNIRHRNNREKQIILGCFKLDFSNDNNVMKLSKNLVYFLINIKSIFDSFRLLKG